MSIFPNMSTYAFGRGGSWILNEQTNPLQIKIRGQFLPRK